MRILITGATGFVGTSLLNALEGRGHELQALCRSDRSAAALAGRASAVVGDLGEPAGLKQALNSARPEVVIHLAAQIASTRSSARIDQINTRGTEALVAAAVAAGVRRVIFTSTVVTGDAHGAVLREDQPLPVETPYGRSKQSSEALLRKRARAGELETVILRPSHVYGCGGWFEGIVKDVKRGRFAIPGDGENFWDLVHVDDVAAALILALEAEAPGELYHVVDDHPLTLNEVIALVATAAGVATPRHVPTWLARAVAGRNAIAAVVRSARSSNALIRRELGWIPKYADCRDAIPAVARALLA